MKIYTVDASVILKWVLGHELEPDPGNAKFLHLMKHSSRIHLFQKMELADTSDS